jgi:RNA polymerase sigma-70 factor (ECF subfamily)
MITQLKHGNQKVLGQLYRQYRTDFLAWMTSHYKCSREVARDVYQDTIFTIMTKAQKGELDNLESSLKTYLFGVGKNKYREYIRKNNKYLQVEDKAWDSLVEPVNEESMEDEVARVKRCLISLGDPCKTVLELYYFHSMSMEEIAEKLPYKNRNTVKNMKYKCLIRLKEIFRDDRVKEKSK